MFGPRIRIGVVGGAMPLAILALVGTISASASPSCVQGVVGQTATFTNTGSEQCYTVPAGVTSIHVSAVGEQGLPSDEPSQAGPQSLGGTVVADVRLPAGAGTLYIEVPPNPTAQQTASTGFGSGAGGLLAGAGGGASTVQTCPAASGACTLTGAANDPRLVVAGGGGGEGDSTGAEGGDAGYLGAPGSAGSPGGGGGGSQTAGGASGGIGALGGTEGQGGSGNVQGGGGGGGWWGGGGGSSGGGGGGGSSFGPPGSVFDTAGAGQTPAVTITPYAPSSSGPTGATGRVGSTGPTGATGPRGRAGQIKLVTCTTTTKHHKKVKRCTTKTLGSSASFTTSERATLSRAGRIYARGEVRDGRLVLSARHAIRPGRYTLTLTVGHRSTRETIAIR